MLQGNSAQCMLERLRQVAHVMSRSTDAGSNDATLAMLPVPKNARLTPTMTAAAAHACATPLADGTPLALGDSCCGTLLAAALVGVLTSGGSPAETLRCGFAPVAHRKPECCLPHCSSSATLEKAISVSDKHQRNKPSQELLIIANGAASPASVHCRRCCEAGAVSTASAGIAPNKTRIRSCETVHPRNSMPAPNAARNGSAATTRLPSKSRARPNRLSAMLRCVSAVEGAPSSTSRWVAQVQIAMTHMPAP